MIDRDFQRKSDMFFVRQREVFSDFILGKDIWIIIQGIRPIGSGGSGMRTRGRLRQGASMEKKFTSKRAVAGVFANALNLLAEGTPKHQQQTAYLSYRMAKELGYPEEDLVELIWDALMYDVGSVILPASREKQEFSFQELSAAGLNIVGDVKQLQFVRRMFQAGQAEPAGDPAYELLSKEARFAEIIDLSRRVSKLLHQNDAALNQVEDISETISNLAGKALHSWAVECFLRVGKTEFVWMDLLHQPEAVLNFIPDGIDLSLDEAIELARFMSRVIDFRSSYTAAHSVGVAVSSVRLAEIMGMSEDECKMMLIAGYVHDIGKLKVPKEILEKGDKLTDEEFNIVKEYAYYTHLLLKDLPGFEQIGKWAALHHEKLNGYGYPFGLRARDIPMGAQILAVADIFSALGEVRSYRQSMEKEGVMKTLAESIEKGAVSGYIVELMLKNFDDIFSIRDEEVRKESARYYASLVDTDE